MNKKEINRIWMVAMLILLASTAPNWLNNKHVSNYDAPWIYPGLEPTNR